MPRYNRNDYRACDWKVSKSDILRNKMQERRKRRISLANVLGMLLVVVVIVLTVDGLIGIYS